MGADSGLLSVEVINMGENLQTRAEHALAIPNLVKEFPLPIRTSNGGMSNNVRLPDGLDPRKVA